MNTKKVYYAVGGNGRGNVFVTRPVRDEKFKVWMGTIIPPLALFLRLGEFELPDISWKDEPVEITISIEFAHVG